MRAAALVLIAGCGRFGFDSGTSVHVTVSGSLSVTSLHAQLAFATVDPDELHAMPIGALPVSAAFPLPDDGGTLVVTVTARDARGRTITGTGQATVFLHHEADVAIALDTIYAATCFDGAIDGTETDVDCGGSCPSCPIGGTCTLAADCGTGRCVAGACEPVSGPPNWLPIAPMPDARIGLAAVLDPDGLIYVFGGGDATDTIAFAPTYRYDDTTNSWTTGPALSRPRVRTAGVTDPQGNIYMVAGGDTGPSTKVDMLAPSASSWTIAPSLLVGRLEGAAALGTDGLVYIAGGKGLGVELDDVERLDAGIWTKLAPMITPRGNVAAALLANGRILVAGGHDYAESIYYANAEVLDPIANTWSTLPPLNHARSDLAAVTAPDGRTYVVGGYNGVGLSFVEAYRSGATSWLDLPATAKARDACAVTLGRDGRLYVLGGRSSSPPDDSVEAYGPQALLDKTSAPVGDKITITGDNFGAMADVVIAIDDVPVEAATTNGAGIFVATFVVPVLGAGAHVVTVEDARSRYPVHRTFVVQ